jgi:DNA-binding MarR family transcriptional regulator
MSAHWLGIKDPSVTQVQLANHAKMEVMLVSNILKVLEGKKLIVRSISKKDTRAKSIKVTAKGESILRPAVKAVEKFDEEFFSVLDRDLPDFNKLLLKVITTNYYA